MNAEQKAEAQRLIEIFDSPYEPSQRTLRSCVALLRTLATEPAPDAQQFVGTIPAEESDDEFARAIEAMDAQGKPAPDAQPMAWVVFVGNEKMKAFDTLREAEDWARTERLGHGSMYVYHIRTAYTQPVEQSPEQPADLR